jgi:hypothetical protein
MFIFFVKIKGSSFSKRQGEFPADGVFRLSSSSPDREKKRRKKMPRDALNDYDCSE